MGKTVLITGAAKGIGSAIASLFAEEGYQVVIHYNTSKDQALALSQTLSKKGFSCQTVQADVTIRSQVDAMMAFCIQHYGGIDVLINNAGIAETALFTQISESSWSQMMAVNINGVFHCTQSALPYMLDQKQGKIIQISSIWGMVGASCEVHYSTAKAAVIGMTKALAKELGPSGIQVNCIAPGVIETDMMAGYSEETLKALKEQTPLGVIGKGIDIARCALFLASDGGNFITGQVLSPNGGFVII